MSPRSAAAVPRRAHARFAERDRCVQVFPEPAQLGLGGAEAVCDGLGEARQAERLRHQRHKDRAGEEVERAGIDVAARVDGGGRARGGVDARDAVVGERAAQARKPRLVCLGALAPPMVARRRRQLDALARHRAAAAARLRPLRLRAPPRPPVAPIAVHDERAVEGKEGDGGAALAAGKAA